MLSHFVPGHTGVVASVVSIQDGDGQERRVLINPADGDLPAAAASATARSQDWQPVKLPLDVDGQVALVDGADDSQPFPPGQVLGEGELLDDGCDCAWCACEGWCKKRDVV